MKRMLGRNSKIYHAKLFWKDVFPETRPSRSRSGSRSGGTEFHKPVPLDQSRGTEFYKPVPLDQCRGTDL